jgi:hypothetical protein
MCHEKKIVDPGLDRVGRGWTGIRPTCMERHWVVLGVDSGLQHLSQKVLQMGGRTLAGTQPSFHIWYTNEWTGLRPYLALSGGLSTPCGHRDQRPDDAPSIRYKYQLRGSRTPTSPPVPEWPPRTSTAAATTASFALRLELPNELAMAASPISTSHRRHVLAAAAATTTTVGLRSSTNAVTAALL